MEHQELSTQEKIIAQGNTLIKLENDTQMSIAIQRPRDEARILQSALKELELYPSMAEEAIYNKPVGKDDKGKQKIAEGLSIRAAESLANRWNNSSYGGSLIGEDEESGTVAAVFLDYETNTRHVIQKRVSKFYKQSGQSGKIVQYTPDRFDTVASANISKVLREVILRSLPAGLKKEYENKAKMLLRGDKLQNRRAAILARFTELQITQEQLEGYKKKSLKEWKHDDITELLGLYNAIKDGEVNAEEVFKLTESKQQEPSGLKFAQSQTGQEETKQEEQENTKDQSQTEKNKESKKKKINPKDEIDCPTRSGKMKKQVKVSVAFCENNCAEKETCPLFQNYLHPENREPISNDCPDSGDQYTLSYCKTNCKAFENCPSWPEEGK